MHCYHRRRKEKEWNGTKCVRACVLFEEMSLQADTDLYLILGILWMACLGVLDRLKVALDLFASSKLSCASLMRVNIPFRSVMPLMLSFSFRACFGFFAFLDAIFLWTFFFCTAGTVVAGAGGWGKKLKSALTGKGESEVKCRPWRPSGSNRRRPARRRWTWPREVSSDSSSKEA